ncbi:hypothetical protein BMI89_12030 [Thioclava sp. F36-7]|nr:hypothetical protein BMI89_12030 [Thioclava sp. F36-7]
MAIIPFRPLEDLSDLLSGGVQTAHLRAMSAAQYRPNPVIKGTRITCRSVLVRLGDGDTLDDLCEEHPSIPREAFEGAATYARTHPVGNPPKADLDDDEPEVCPTELQANLLLVRNGKFANRIWPL